ncbi:DUF411 domain-containing protein [Kangiella sediminilitoris]|nr:DUF411 domain-containing protein [Kangiella sediminilitoris]
MGRSPNETSDSLKELHLVIYKNQGCSCCDKWALHLDKQDIETDMKISPNLNAIKKELGIDPRLSSCHTAVYEAEGRKFVFEGHIPAKYIKQFLANPPKEAIGLTVPAMPVGSPGMEYQDKFMPYKIFQINNDGQIAIYAEIKGFDDQH